MEEAVSSMDLRSTAAWKMASRGNALICELRFSRLGLNSAPGAELGRPPVPVGAVGSWSVSDRVGWTSCFFPILLGLRYSQLQTSQPCKLLFCFTHHPSTSPPAAASDFALLKHLPRTLLIFFLFLFFYCCF